MRTSRLVGAMGLVSVAACTDKPAAAADTAAVPEGRPAVALHGTWVRVYPSNDTLMMRPGGVASGPPAMPGFGRTTRWRVDDTIDQSMVCFGDKKTMSCTAVRVRGDTLSVGDHDNSVYVRAR